MWGRATPVSDPPAQGRAARGRRAARFLLPAALAGATLLGCGEENPGAPPDTTPPARVSTFSIDSVWTDGLLLGWTATGDDSITGRASAYDIRYSLQPDSAASWWDSLAVSITDSMVPKEPGERESLRVTGLLSDTLYFVGLVVEDEAGNRSALSNVASARTESAQVEPSRLALLLAQVLDTSGSMAQQDAISFLRTGATAFTGLFDETVDKMALIRFASGRKVLVPLDHDFVAPIAAAVALFQAEGGTTSGDAIAAAAAEILSDPEPGAYRAILFFTDGRPTSFRETFRIGEEDVDGVIGGYSNPAASGGYPPPRLFDPTEIYQELPYDTPAYLPDGRMATTAEILSESRLRTLQAASSAREGGIAIFAVALGNPSADGWNRPDAELMVEIANIPSAPDPYSEETIVNENYDPDEPTGAFYFARTAEDLEGVLGLASADIIARLTPPPIVRRR